MVIIGVALLVAALVLLGVLLHWSPGTPQPFLDAQGQPVAGSLAEKSFVELNGVRHGLFIKSRDVRHPVLLYLHGGMPDYFLTERFPTGLDEEFTVVWWEQRGSGLSASSDIPRESLTVDQLVSDVIAMSNHLRARFGQEKIYLMGHSGGTFLGLQAVARAPELFHAYLGVAQMTYQLESERLAWEYMVGAYRANGDAKMLEKLEAAPVTISGGIPPAWLALRDGAMHGLGIGTMHQMKSVVSGLLLPSFRFSEYTLTEKLRLWSAKASSGVSVVWNDMIATDLREQVKSVAVPVYFFHGAWDYTVNYELARAYLGRLEAPVKGFYSFTNSAHSPLFEEPGRMLQVIREDVLQRRAMLADP